MAIRWGLGQLGVPPAPFHAIAVDASWNMSAPTMRRGAMMGPAGNDQSQVALDIPATETSTTNPYTLCAAQYVSPPLQAQSVAAGSTVSICFQSAVSNVAATSTPRAVVRLFNESGGYVSTLFAGSISSGALSTGQRVNSALAVALTAFAPDDGYRIVVEIGHSHANAVATSYTSTTRIGHMPLNQSQLAFTNANASAGTSWVEFSATLAVQNEADFYSVWSEVMATPDSIEAIEADLWMEALGEQLPVEASVTTLWAETLGVQSPVEAALTTAWAEVLGIAGELPPEGPPGIPNVPGTGRLYVQHEGVWYPLPAIAGVVT